MPVTQVPRAQAAACGPSHAFVVCFVVLSKLPLCHEEAETYLMYSIYIIGFALLNIMRLMLYFTGLLLPNNFQGSVLERTGTYWKFMSSC